MKSKTPLSESRKRHFNLVDLQKLARNVLVWAAPALILNLTAIQSGTMSLENFWMGVAVSMCIEFLRRYSTNMETKDIHL